MVFIENYSMSFLRSIGWARWGDRDSPIQQAHDHPVGAASERNRSRIDAIKAICRLFGLVQSTQFDDFDLEGLQVVCAPFQVGF